MTESPFLVHIDESASDGNPAVAAEIRGEGVSGRKKKFSDRQAAVEWCDRMGRIGKKRLELLPNDDFADAKVAWVEANLDDEIEVSDEEEGGFDDFLNDAF